MNVVLPMGNGDLGLMELSDKGGALRLVSLDLKNTNTGLCVLGLQFEKTRVTGIIRVRVIVHKLVVAQTQDCSPG